MNDQIQLLIDAGEANLEMAKAASETVTELRQQNTTLQTKVDTLTSELESSEVEVVKVASSNAVPEAMATDIADTLVANGFVDKSERGEVSAGIADGGVGALVGALKKVASTAIPNKTCVVEGNATSLNKKASTPANTQLNNNDLVWKEELEKAKNTNH